MRTITFVLLSLLAVPLSAAPWFEISPAAPTSETPIAITFTTESMADCGPTDGEVTVSGKTVHVRLFRSPDVGVCPPDVRERRVRVEIGTLPIGDYTFTADYKAIQWRGRFVVRNPAVHMIVVPGAGGSPVVVGVFATEVCADPSCPGVAVTFGGIPALTPHLEQGALVVTAPPGDPRLPALLDIEVTAPRGLRIVIPGGVYYSGLEPDLTVFEPVLFPVLESGPGAFGSRWTTRATIDNHGVYFAEPYNRIDRFLCLDVNCDRPGAPNSVFEFDGSGFPQGAVLYVPRAEPLVFGLRIRETTHSDDPGIELVPVRGSQFFRNGMTLVNVPVGSAYRTKLRIYAFEPAPATVVTVALRARDGRRSYLSVPLERRSGLGAVPFYAEIDLQKVFAREADSVTIRIDWRLNTPVWAFASAVHNASQRMIAITPQP